MGRQPTPPEPQWPVGVPGPAPVPRQPRARQRKKTQPLPSPRREPPPDPRRTWKSLAEAREHARTWDEWLGAEASIGRYGASVAAPPWQLDWQRNPRAPIPPGWQWARCLCFATVVRPASWHGQVKDKNLLITRSTGPAVRIGDLCDACGAPLVPIRRRTDPYVIDLDPPTGPAPAVSRHAGGVPQLAAALRDGSLDPGPATPPAVLRPAPRRHAPAPSRFPSMAAEKAWVAARRRQGLLVD
jgi:hypothetical protein